MVSLRRASLVIPDSRRGGVRIDSLIPGSTFDLLWDSEGGKSGIEGTVLYHTPGYTKVRLKKPMRLREFEGKDGRHHEVLAQPTHDTEWSLGTLVLLKEEPVASKVSLSRAAQVKEEDDMAVKDKGNGKAKPAAKVAKAKKEADTPCGCGCGELVVRTFKQGHDARHYGRLKRVVAGKMEFSELPKVIQKKLVDIKGAKKELAAHAH